MGVVKSFYVRIWNRDGSVIAATGRREIVSSRCSTSIMAYHLMLAMLDDHPERQGRVHGSPLSAEITPEGPARRSSRAARRRKR